MKTKLLAVLAVLAAMALVLALEVSMILWPTGPDAGPSAAPAIPGPLDTPAPPPGELLRVPPPVSPPPRDPDAPRDPGPPDRDGSRWGRPAPAGVRPALRRIAARGKTPQRQACMCTKKVDFRVA